MMRRDTVDLDRAGAAALRLAVGGLIVGSVGAWAALQAADMSLKAEPALVFAAVLAALAAAAWFYTVRRREPQFALMTGAIGLMIGSALCAGIIAHAGLRLQFALADPIFAQADRALGIDTPGLVLAVAHRSWLAALLGAAYNSIFPGCFVTALWLGWQCERGRLARFVTGFVLSVQVAALVSVFVPARGNIAFAGLEQLSGHGLPPGSGTYFLAAFDRFRGGTDPLLDIWTLNGVVCFPSFHMVMALLVAAAFRGQPLLGPAIGGWCGLVAVSTIPNGGHYVIDVLAGAGLWAATLLLARAPSARRQRRPQAPVSRSAAAT